jgi:CheY-like chemotaxis protein
LARATILTAATAFLLLRSWRFASYSIEPGLRILKAETGDPVRLVESLIHFDFFATVLPACVLLWVLTNLAGHPGKPGVLPLIRQRKPVRTFLLAGILGVFLLIIAPVLIGYVGPGSDLRTLDDIKNFIPNPRYIQVAVCAAFGFALFCADVAVRGPAVRWWTALFLFVPVLSDRPYIGSSPLIWWCALAGWLPSRYWSAWKPVAAALTMAVPIFMYPNAQPIMKVEPSFEAATRQILNECAQPYGVRRTPDRPELWLSCTDALLRYERTNDHWELSARVIAPFRWDQTAFDFKRNRGYAFDGMSGLLHIYSLRPATEIDVIEISAEDFPVHSIGIHSSLDPEEGVLIIAENKGVILAWDTVSRETIMSRFVGAWSLENVSRFLVDVDRHELLVLHRERLASYGLRDLAPHGSVALPDFTEGLVVDKERNRVLVTQPRGLSIIAIDRETFHIVGTGEASAGVRSLALDEERRLLISASVSGVVEVRDADDFSLKARARLAPWARRLEILPEFGEVVITRNDVGAIVWRYDPPDVTYDLFDVMFRGFNRVGRHVFLKLKEMAGEKSFNVKAAPGSPLEDVFADIKTVLVVDSNERDRGAIKGILKLSDFGGLHWHEADGGAEMKEVLSRAEEPPNLAIISKDLAMPDGGKVKEWLSKNYPNIIVLESVETESEVDAPFLRKPFTMPRTAFELSSKVDSFKYRKVHPQANR